MSFAIKRFPLSRMIAPLLHQQQSHLRPLPATVHTNSQLNSFKSWYQSKWLPRKLEPPYTHIVQVGDPVLRQKSAPVPLDAIKSKELNFFIDQLIRVMSDYQVAGIAAPQVGIDLQIIILEFSEQLKREFSPEIYKVREMETLPLTVLINPEMKVTDYSKRTYEEACASVCGYKAEVTRYAGVTLTGLNRNGEKQELHLKGWNARIAQHEMDHLNGIMYTDVMNPTDV
ncbi:hypothetical protein HA402_002318 [Bradysia odoriphaga]|nr:hypothetical protein HA402_002318 [Bradysia odoriphaga]